MATKDFKIRHSLTVAQNATIEGNLTLGGKTVSRLIDSDEVTTIINNSSSGFDSDQIVAIINENVVSGSVDSDVAAIAQLRRDADSDSIRIQEIATSLELINELVDSDLKAIADLRNDVDSDSIKIQAINTELTGLELEILGVNASLNAKIDSDSARIDALAAAGVGVVSQESTFTTFKYKATQGQTTFSGLDRDNQTLSYTVGNINVFINGILINDSDDYTATNGTSVVLLLAADSDDVVVVQKARSAFDSDTILSIWNNNQANLTITRFDYTATQSQTVFSGADDNGSTLSYVATKIQVYLNGILLLDGTDYTATNGTSLTLTVAADSDDKLSIIKYLGADAAASDNINVTAYTFTSPANDSDFSGLDNNGRTLAYVANKIHVYLNGILLSNSTDYTAVDGSSVTLTNAPDSDDVLTVIKYLGTTQSGFDSEQIVAIINENASTLPWVEKTSSTSITVGQKVIVDTSTAVTLTLPSSASLGDEIRIIDGTGNAATNNITVARNGHNIMGAASDLIINLNAAGIGLVYYNASRGWILIEN